MSPSTKFAFAAVAFAAGVSMFASAGAATMKKGRYCFAGSSTPMSVCDAIKASTKPKPASTPTEKHPAKNAIRNIR